ncbi:hypothetical protein SAMN05428966_10257 [Massilia sp. PDC64]|nr:hypothetical protein [Massilia sp. PDC64]SDC65837.1 hypothetical protein SAMN05428966_10257 [Massilia sp. PDC64]
MHPKYWTRPRVMAPLESEGSAGGAPAAEDFATFFDNSVGADDQQQSDATAQASAESPEDAAARLAAEDAANADQGDQTQQTDPADADANADAQPKKFTIDVDGKPVELTEAEMAEHVKNGMRQADYSRKTAEVAEQRRAAEAQQAEARAQRDQYAAKLDAFSQQTNYEVNALRAQLTDELLQSDPLSYMQIQRTADQRQAQLQQAQQALQQINEQRTQEKAEADRHHAMDQREKLLAKVPEWKDEAKAKAEVSQLKEYLVQQGYEPGEADFTDHRSVILARKAMQYDALMARAKATQTKVAAAPPKVARTSAPVPANDGRPTSVRRFEQTGSRDDAAAAFADMFG